MSSLSSLAATMSLFEPLQVARLSLFENHQKIAIFEIPLKIQIIECFNSLFRYSKNTLCSRRYWRENPKIRHYVEKRTSSSWLFPLRKIDENICKLSSLNVMNRCVQDPLLNRGVFLENLMLEMQCQLRVFSSIKCVIYHHTSLTRTQNWHESFQKYPPVVVNASLPPLNSIINTRVVSFIPIDLSHLSSKTVKNHRKIIENPEKP